MLFLTAIFFLFSFCVLIPTKKNIVRTNINIKIIPTGNILTEIKNEFESKGINQTVYRIYLELTCKVSIVTQYKTIEDEIINQVLLVESVIVGEVPQSYYNLEGLNQDDAIELIE